MNKLDNNFLLNTDCELNISKKEFDFNERIETAHAVMLDICKSLLNDTGRKYDAVKTIEIIDDYIKKENKLDRILYSDISNYIFELTDKQIDKFISNTEKLLEVVQTTESHSDIKSMVIKIHDHVLLAHVQKNSIQKNLYQAVATSKQNLQKDIDRALKNSEKEYIGILGIFSSVVLAFTGGIAFSTSVLQNIHLASPYRIFAAIILIGFVFINIIYLLFHYIDKIVHGNTQKRHWYIIVVDFVLAALLIGVGVSWYFGFFDEKSSYLESIRQIEEQIEEELQNVLKSKINVSITVGDQPQEQIPSQDPYAEPTELDDVQTEAE